ncbi:MAG: protein kinase [Planctomycetota bacterium]
MSEESDDTLLEQLLERALDLQEQGQPVDVAALCAEHPRLASSVAAALARVPELARMHVESAQADAFLGRLLARRYRLEERVGSGAMGVVYRGFDLALDREVAVKVLRPELLVGERMDVRLAREGQVLAGIRHQNVVTVFDRGQAEDGRTFLVMELLRGHNASRLLRSLAEAHGGPVNGMARAVAFRDVLGIDVAVGEGDVRQVVRWIVAAADGLQAAHASGVVHRDVKPSNLFLERAGRVVLLDFGIVSSGGHGTLGSDGSPFGTPAYMAPEQLDTNAEPDVRSDVYSLTATLYHLLTGRAPFDGTVQQVLAAIPSVEPLAVERVRPGLPVDLAAVVEKGMAKDPARRYQSARELRDDLQAWLEFRPVSARRVSRWTAAWRRARRSPRLRTVAASLLAAGLVFGGWQWSVMRAAERSQWENVRAERELELWSQVPPSLVNDLPSFRAANALRKSARVAALLDELVQVDAGTGAALALRAMHRSDGGDLAGAAEDLEQLASRGDAPFAAAAAASYRRGELPDVMVQGEEAPVTGGIGDRFAAVLHAMRSRGARPMWVEELLERDDALARYPGFAELHLLLRQRRAYDRADLDAIDQVSRDARHTEVRRQHDSAICHQLQMNAAMLRQPSPEDLLLAERAMELAPDGFSLIALGGNLTLKASDWARALGLFQRAAELQPSSPHALDGWCRALIGLGRLDEAEAMLVRPPFAATEDGVFRCKLLEGVIAYHRAQVVRDASRVAAQRGEAPSDAWRALAESAKQHFEAARQLAGDDAETSIEELLCDGMLGAAVPCVQLLELLSESPTNDDLLRQAAPMLPTTMGSEEVKALRTLLLLQADALGPANR